MLVSSRNHYGCWTIPGGGLEPGETADVTAVREAREEVSLLTSIVLLNKSYFCLGMVSS